MPKDLRAKLMVHPGTRVRLSQIDPDDTHGVSHDEADEALPATMKRMEQLQYTLFAECKHSMLIVLQAMDAGGKDSTIRHVFTAFNPQGCRVTSFKVPTAEELGHDFLWRVHKAVPGKGEIGVFNRSHYEDVLVVRVHELVPREVWSERYEHINVFERLLVESGTVVLKFFLHVSKEEQMQRFEERQSDPTKRWKYSPNDLEERKRWDDYMAAYEDALSLCSTAGAPWYVIPADRKWFRNFAVAQIIGDAMGELKMECPPPQGS